MTVRFDLAKQAFDDHVYVNSKKTVTRTPVTVQYDNVSGSKNNSDGTPDATFTGVFFKESSKFFQDNPGLVQGADVIMLIKTTQTLNKNDKITYDSEDYRADSIVDRYHGSVEFWKMVRLFKI